MAPTRAVASWRRLAAKADSSSACRCAWAPHDRARRVRGGGRLKGLKAIEDAARSLGDANPLGHHVTNVVVTSLKGDQAMARSKGLGVMSDGAIGTVVYEDALRRTADGWRIAVRPVLPRKIPLHPSGE